MKRLSIFLVVAALVALPGQSQQGNGSSPPPTNGSSSVSTGTGTANAVVNQITSSRAGFVQAVPGGIPGTFPGYAPEDPGCYMHAPKGIPPVSNASINSMAQGGKLPHGTHVTVIDPSATTQYDGAIGLMTYNPRVIINPGDKMLASIIVTGVYHHPDEQLMGVVLRELRKAAPAMQRAAIINCPEAEGVTKANTFGFGITTSGTPESGNVAGSGAVGFTHGVSKSMRQVHSTFYAYALNAGPLEPPAPPLPQMPQATQPSPQPQPAPPVQTIRIEVVSVQPAPQPLIPSPAADPCASMPKGIVYHRFNHPEVDPQYLPVIKIMEDWLEAHPSCTIAVEGYASFEGTDRYNEHLGEQRAQNVYDILVANKAIAGQIARYLSAGKHFAIHDSPNPENTWEDRKTVFAIRNITSE